MKTRYCFNWLLLLVFGVSASSVLAGEIVPFFDDTSAVYSLTAAKDSVAVNEIDANETGVVTFAAKFTLDEQSIIDSETGAVLILENGGTTSGNGIYLVNGQFAFLFKTGQPMGYVSSLDDTNFTDGVAGVALAPAEAEVETSIYVCFSVNNSRIVSNVNGVGRVIDIQMPGTVNIQGNRSIAFLGTAPAAAPGGDHGWLGALSDDVNSGVYYRENCKSASLVADTPVLAQFFFMDINPVWMPTVTAPADNAVNVDPMVTTKFEFAAPKDPADSTTDLAGVTNYTVNVYDMYENEPNFLAPPASVTVTGTECDFSLFEDGSEDFLQLDDVVYWSVDANVGSDIISGPVWKFTALPSIPNITIQPLADADIVGGSVSFKCTIISKTAFTNATKWVKVGSEGTDLTSDTRYQVTGPVLVDTDTYEYTLTVSGLIVDDEGMYYATVENAAGPQDSAQVALGVQREIAYWPLDGVTDGVYEDVVGGYDADPNGTPAETDFVEGKIGSALNVAADSELVGVTEAFAAAAYTDELTITAWIKRSPVEGDISLDGVICSNNPINNWFFEFDNFTGTISANAPGYNPFSGAGAASYYPSIEDGEWTFIALTSSANAVGKLYINGEQVGISQSYSIDQNESLVFIGGAAYEGTVVRDSFAGMLDDVHIYNYALSNEGIAQKYYDITLESACLDRDAESLQFDFDHNCKVDLEDFATFAAGWMNSGLYPSSVD